MTDKIIRDDMETGAQMFERVREGFKSLPSGNNLVVCHHGLSTISMMDLGKEEFLIRNCGLVGVVVDHETGKVVDIIGNYNPPHIS